MSAEQKDQNVTKVENGIIKTPYSFDSGSDLRSEKCSLLPLLFLLPVKTNRLRNMLYALLLLLPFFVFWNTLYTLLLILPFFVFPLSACTRLVRDLFLMLHHLHGTNLKQNEAQGAHAESIHNGVH